MQKMKRREKRMKEFAFKTQDGGVIMKIQTSSIE
jgi:hypothetical protein